jgi:hypothetical protein
MRRRLVIVLVLVVLAVYGLSRGTPDAWLGCDEPSEACQP